MEEDDSGSRSDERSWDRREEGFVVSVDLCPGVEVRSSQSQVRSQLYKSKYHTQAEDLELVLARAGTLVDIFF